jgi:hypothetical protein
MGALLVRFCWSQCARLGQRGWAAYSAATGVACLALTVWPGQEGLSVRLALAMLVGMTWVSGLAAWLLSGLARRGADTMSAKSVAEKLLIKPNTTVWSSDAARLELVEPLPAGVRLVDGPEQATTALVFADDAASLREVLTAHQASLARPEVLWVAYPKGNRADINRDTLWPILGEYGLRPVTQVSVDEVWSALRFRPPKKGEAPFTGGRS